MQKFVALVVLFSMSACVMADESARTLSVSGNGVASVQPDRAMVSMSIVARDKDLAAAQKEAAEVTAKVLALGKDLGIERKHIDTTGSSVRADYQWNREREEQVLRGYIAQRQLHIDVRDLELLGRVVEGSVAAGVNQVSPPVLDSEKRSEMHRDALANAAKDARANAERLAKTLGTKLGAVLRISDGAAAPSPMPQQRMAMAASAGAEQTYNAAELTVSATVQVVFALQD